MSFFVIHQVTARPVEAPTALVAKNRRVLKSFGCAS